MNLYESSQTIFPVVSIKAHEMTVCEYGNEEIGGVFDKSQ